jgi:WD40 repeat protein
MHAAGFVLSLLCAAAQDYPGEILRKHCAGCHNPKDREGELVLDTYEGLAKGGENGPVVVAGKPDESPLLLSIEHRKKPFMPPPKKAAKLKDEEIAAVRAWLSAGAAAPKTGNLRSAAPKIEPKVAPRRSYYAAAYEPKSKLVALARYGEVDLVSAETRQLVRTLKGHAGNVNDLAFSVDGARLAAAAGDPGAGGQVLLWSAADGKLLHSFKAHTDAVYAVAISPDGRLLATGSYDHKIEIWDAGGDALLRTLDGHNEAVFDLAFRPDGKVLASASGDRTVKLWELATGKRLDTLSESTKALFATAFSRDGKRVAAAGADNRIRVWDLGPAALEGTNELVSSTFAHEGTILRLAYSVDGRSLLSSSDDRGVKLWNAADLSPLRVLERQPDWAPAVVFALDDKAVVAGRLDGSLQVYEVSTGNPLAVPKPPPPAKPELSGAEPRGLRRGGTTRIRVTGKNLSGIGGALVSGRAEAKTLSAGDGTGVVIEVSADRSLPLGTAQLTLWNAGGESAPLTLSVEDLDQVGEAEPNDAPSAATLSSLPATLWGSFGAKGDPDHWAFDGRAGQTIVLDAAAKRIGSKAELVVTLLDASGRVLASNIDYEGEADPLLAHVLPADGRYLVRMGDLTLGSSAEHVYRLTVGELAVVTGVHPLGVPVGVESRVLLAGHNLPAGAFVPVKPTAPGEVTLPVDPERFRLRRPFKVTASAEPEAVEAEPNGKPGEATRIAVPGAANGRIERPGDADLYRFEAKAGQAWVIETQAQQRGTPVDTRLEVLHADGRPVERVLLRAVRDSWITFRPINSDANGARLWQWEEMDLNQILYLQGEVVRLSLAPRGPDSQWDFFAPAGKRICLFDTSPTAHAIDEPAYIVEPHPPGTKLPANGLPQFLLHTENDDDPLRKLGTDSRIHFAPPADGSYLVRVTDSRDFGGDRNAYRLLVREARPDARVTLEGVSPGIPAGSGLGFTVRVDRQDGFEGPVTVDLGGVPPGYLVSTPVKVEPGLFEAKGTIYALPDAPKPKAAALKATARFTVGGKETTREIATTPALNLTEQPKVRVFLEPWREDGKPLDPAAPLVIEAAAGKLTPALLRIERSGFADRVSFDVENLPFGIIVADIGLNGVLIPENQTERKIFLEARPWVAPQERLAHARAREVGNPTSRPVLVRVLPRR